YLLLNRVLLNSPSLKVIIIAGLIICNVRFYLLASLFNKEYSESVEITINENEDLYVSKVSSSSSLFGKQSYFRVYKSNFPFSKTIEIIYASEVKWINNDTTVYVLQCFSKRGVDTVYVSKTTSADK